MKKLIVEPEAHNQFLLDWNNAKEDVEDNLAEVPGDVVEIFEDGHTIQGQNILFYADNYFEYQHVFNEVTKLDPDFIEESGY